MPNALTLRPRSPSSSRIFPKLFLLAGILMGTWVLPAQVWAEKETCKQCKFADCLKSAIKQKEAMRAAYLELAAKWQKFWVQTDSGSPVPLDQINLDSLSSPMARMATLSLLNPHFTQLQKEEEEMANRIGAPTGCGYNPAESLEMVTDSIQCQTDMMMARKAEEASPCKELYEIAFRHEAMHMVKCQERKGNKVLPPIVLTPAGKAREEAAAYAQEIAELKKLLEEISGGTLELDGKASATMPYVGTIAYSIKGKFPFNVEPEAPFRISGGGEYTAEADTSGSSCRINGFDQGYGIRLEGNREGEILKFKLIPTGTTVIPAMRLSCPRGGSFSFPVARLPGEQSFANKDGESFTKDLTQFMAGRGSGGISLTLRLCKGE